MNGLRVFLRSAFLSVLVLSASVTAQAQTATVVTNCESHELTNVSGTLYFACEYSNLWKSDGAASGTVMLRNVGGEIENVTAVNGMAFFTVLGNQLWRTDGTTEGTTLLRRFRDSNSWEVLGGFIAYQCMLYFAGDDGVNGLKLWRSDGTAAGTVMVKDINPQPTDPAYDSRAGWSWPWSLVEMNGELFFKADDGTHGAELWKSDGTAAGTVMVKDINTGPYSYGSWPGYLTVVNGVLFFSADNGTVGSELWRSDGAAAGISLVKDIRSGSSSSSPYYLESFNGGVYFQAEVPVTEFQKQPFHNSGSRRRFSCPCPA